MISLETYVIQDEKMKDRIYKEKISMTEGLQHSFTKWTTIGILARSSNKSLKPLIRTALYPCGLCHQAASAGGRGWGNKCDRGCPWPKTHGTRCVGEGWWKDLEKLDRTNDDHKYTVEEWERVEEIAMTVIRRLQAIAEYVKKENKAA